MATYKINIDEKNASGKHFLALMKSLPFISFLEKEKKKMSGLDEALEDIKKGRVKEIKDIDKFFKQMRSEVDAEI